MEAMVGWMNNDGNQDVQNPLTHGSLAALIPAITGTVNVTRCNKDELSGIQTSWSDQNRACGVEAIAVWSVSGQSFSWKSENWRVGQHQNQNRREENLMIFSTVVPSGESKEQTSNKKYLLVCRFIWLHEVTGSEKSDSCCSPQGQYYVISCPPSVLPLGFATIVPTCGQLPWKLDQRQVLPLPGQN